MTTEPDLRKSEPTAPVPAEIQPVSQALRAGQPFEAAKLLVDAAADLPVLKDASACKWLQAILGKDAFAALIDAFVHFPCFYCKKGRTVCETCEGKGRSGSEPVCEACLGLGLERCDFCGGSGWVAMNYVPLGLRPIVAAGRTSLALARMKALLAQEVPTSGPPNSRLNECGRMLLYLDRQMAVFENALAAYQEIPEALRGLSGRLQPLVESCIQLGVAAEERVRETILALAAAYRAAEKASSGGSVGLARRAEFYESLGHPGSTLAGTGLEHPFLHRAAKEVRTTRAEST